jgi:hypothetical protein
MNHQLMFPRILLSLTKTAISALFLGTGLILSAASSPSVTGSISFYIGPDIMHLDFQAVQNADRTVTGEAHNSLNDGPWMPIIAHLRLDCLLFLDDHTVILGGQDVWDTDPEYVGDRVVFVVQDNGEGNDAEPDLIAGTYYASNVPIALRDALTDCEAFAAFLEAHPAFLGNFFSPALTGNIQVHP